MALYYEFGVSLILKCQLGESNVTPMIKDVFEFQGQPLWMSVLLNWMVYRMFQLFLHLGVLLFLMTTKLVSTVNIQLKTAFIGLFLLTKRTDDKILNPCSI